MIRRRFSRDQWAKWISAQAASGQSAAVFCKRRQLPLPTFYLWRRKMASESSDDTRDSTLVPLKIVANEHVDVELACGATIKLPVDNEQTTKKVLAVLVDLGRSE